MKKPNIKSKWGSSGMIHFEKVPVPRQPRTPHYPVEIKKLYVQGVPSAALGGTLEEVLETSAKCQVDSVIYSPTIPGSVMLTFDRKPGELHHQNIFNKLMRQVKQLKFSVIVLHHY